MERQGRRLAKRLNVRRRVRLSETWPLPTGVYGNRQSGPNGFSREARATYSQRTLEGHVVPLHTLNGLVWDSRPPIFQDRSNVDGFPFDRHLDSYFSVFLSLQPSK